MQKINLIETTIVSGAVTQNVQADYYGIAMHPTGVYALVVSALQLCNKAVEVLCTPCFSNTIT